MKYFFRIITLLLAVSISNFVNAQGINFQGVARSANGTIIASSNISLRLSIISKNVDATPEYIETKTVVTNPQGIFSVVVGDATNAVVTGNFKNIAWKDGIKFLKVEMDPSAGTNYINMGATQLQYVPFSYYANGVDAANVAGVLPVKSGGTGFTTLSDLKAAINKSESSTFLNRINFTDENANDHINKYDTGYNSPLIYSRYFYGHYGDLVIQGMSKTYTGNIHFVTGSNIAGYDPPTQRMVIMDNGNIGIGDFTPFNPPTSKLQVNGMVSATGYKVPGGTSTQYLRADGTVTNSVTAGVPYSGASQAVDLGSYDMKVNGITVGIGSGTTTVTNNTAIGKDALLSNTTGVYNSAIGYQSLSSSTSGSANSALGYFALNSNTMGVFNSAFGSNALQSNTSGNQNTAIGVKSLISNRTGNDNTAIGKWSMYNNLTGERNTAIGLNTLFSNVGNNGSISIGYNAMYYADDRTTGRITGNTAVGYEALMGSSTPANNTGVDNTAIGKNALKVNSSGSNNTALGQWTLASNSSGFSNTAIGNASLGNSLTGNKNTAVGVVSLANLQTGENNLAIGFWSGFNLNSGDNNIIIGANAEPSSNVVNNEITIGNSNNNVIRSAVTTITSLSDARDKKNINDLSIGLNFINSLKPRVFNWDKREWYKTGVSDGSKISNEQTAGFIAQELDESQNKYNADWLKLVYKSNPNKWEATYGNLLPIVVKSIQELSAEKDKMLDDQYKEIKALKERLDTLEKLMNELLNKKL